MKRQEARKRAAELVAERQYFQGSQMGAGPRNLRGGSVSERSSWRAVHKGASGGRTGDENRRLRQAFLRAFTSVDENGERAVRSRKFRIWAGFSQPDPRSEKLTGNAVLAQNVEL